MRSRPAPRRSPRARWRSGGLGPGRRAPPHRRRRAPTAPPTAAATDVSTAADLASEPVDAPRAHSSASSWPWVDAKRRASAASVTRPTAASSSSTTGSPARSPSVRSATSCATSTSRPSTSRLSTSSTRPVQSGLEVVASPGHRVEVGRRDVIEVGDQDPPCAWHLEQLGPAALGHHHRAELPVRLARGHLRVAQPPWVEMVAHAPGARDVQRDVVEDLFVPRTQPELVGGIRLDHDVSVVRGPGARDEVDPPREVADAHGGDGAFLGGPVAAGTGQADLAGDGAIHRPGRRQPHQ